ncbi:hypothetical protein CAS74_000967 [Pichia kudriavzevii]|uniref:Eukaryotic translation initiation factor 3 subunit G n=2 Tax=Pichia kudriavzevii TaxID=4909 RepID=A0A1Z8JVN5_PICKU|nr:hypothetical protein CAS74_000967 [Pichia kudriavzevii]
MSTNNWADAGAALPEPEVIDNNDGTKTVISYKYNDQKKKVKVTQRIKFVKTTETINTAVARRMKWAKFGLEKENGNKGPDFTTTTVTEAVKLTLSTTWKADEEKEQEIAKKSTTTSAFKCRFCGNTGHYSAKCPYKDTLGMAGMLKPAGGDSLPANAPPPQSTNSRYVLPHMRAGAKPIVPASEVPALRVTNLNAAIDRDMLRMIVSKYAEGEPVERVSILRNRDTGEPIGVAFVNMTTMRGAELVKDALDGKGLMNMIISVDFAKPKK